MRHFLILRASEQNARANAVGHVVNGEIIRDFVQLGDNADARRLPQVSAPKFSEEDATSLAETAPLLASAIRNEEIRLDYEALIDRFRAFDHLRAEFLGVMQRFVAVVDESEEVKKDKAELQGHLELSEAVGAELRAARTDLEPKYETLVSEKVALEAAGERARDTIAKTEAAKQKNKKIILPRGISSNSVKALWRKRAPISMRCRMKSLWAGENLIASLPLWPSAKLPMSRWQAPCAAVKSRTGCSKRSFMKTHSRPRA